MNPKDVIFTECARCGKFAVHPDEWVDLCPTCIFQENLTVDDESYTPTSIYDVLEFGKEDFSE